MRGAGLSFALRRGSELSSQYMSLCARLQMKRGQMQVFGFWLCALFVTGVCEQRLGLCMRKQSSQFN
jgi:hypothetical protein